MGPIGLPELLIVLFVILLILGPKRLPGLGRSLGSGMRELKDSITRKDKDPELETGSSSEAEPQPVEGEVVSEPRR